jgi:hypothetical protein
MLLAVLRRSLAERLMVSNRSCGVPTDAAFALAFDWAGLLKYGNYASGLSTKVREAASSEASQQEI